MAPEVDSNDSIALGSLESNQIAVGCWVGGMRAAMREQNTRNSCCALGPNDHSFKGHVFGFRGCLHLLEHHKVYISIACTLYRLLLQRSSSQAMLALFVDETISCCFSLCCLPLCLPS